MCSVRHVELEVMANIHVGRAGRQLGSEKNSWKFF